MADAYQRSGYDPAAVHSALVAHATLSGRLSRNSAGPLNRSRGYGPDSSFTGSSVGDTSLSLSRMSGRTRRTKTGGGRRRKKKTGTAAAIARRATDEDYMVNGKLRPRDGRIYLNKKGLRDLASLGPHQPKLEFLYARDNYLRNFQGLGYMPMLTILDVSSNCLESLEFLGVLPALRELYLNANMLTSLDDLPTIPTLEVLSVCQNDIDSFRYMQTQPNLRALFLSYNRIVSLDGLPPFPLLESIRVTGNPIEQNEQFVLTFLIACGDELRKLNGQEFLAEEKELAKSFSAVASTAIRYGWMVGDEDPATFLLDRQIEECADTPIQLAAATVAGALQEGQEVTGHFSFAAMEVQLMDVEAGPHAESGLYFDFQWLRGDRSGAFTEIPGACLKSYAITADDVGFSLKCECTPVINLDEDDFGETVFCVTAVVEPADPVALTCTIEGECVEGKTVTAMTEYMGGDEEGSLFSWFRCPMHAAAELIPGANGRTYTLTRDDVGCELRVEWTPIRSDGVQGDPILGASYVIQAAPPHIDNLEIMGEPVETHVLEAIGDYFGGREGRSRFQWFRSEAFSKQIFHPIPGATDREYVLSVDDVDRHVRFEYLPISDEGVEGFPHVATTGKVAAYPPSISDLYIDGALEEGGVLEAVGNYLGGKEGRSQITWSRMAAEVYPSGRWDVMIKERKRRYRLGGADVGFFFKVEYTPVRSDGVFGDPKVAITPAEVVDALPRVLSLTIEGPFVEGHELEATREYIGGIEGESSCAWYRSMDENHTEFEIIEDTENSMMYTPGPADVGRILKFNYFPVRFDGVVGKEASVRTSTPIAMGPPQFKNPRIVGQYVERQTLRVEGDYFGGEAGDLEYKWYRVRQSQKKMLLPARGGSYTLTAADIRSGIQVMVRPIRCDGVKGDWVYCPRDDQEVAAAVPTVEGFGVTGDLSEGSTLETTGDYFGGQEGNSICQWYKVHPEFDTIASVVAQGATFTILPEHVGSRLRVDYTPIRHDGAVGDVVSVLTSIVKPARPELDGITFALADGSGEAAGRPLRTTDEGETSEAGAGAGGDLALIEGVEIVPSGNYQGGAPGNHVFAWHHMDPDTQERGAQVADTMTYTPTYDDVGKFLVFVWTPVRDDGEEGEPVELLLPSSVAEGLPTVHDVDIELEDDEDPMCVRVGVGIYSGGVEGASTFAWFRVNAAGVRTALPGATDRRYAPVREDIGCSLVFAYTPIRGDGTVGTAVESDPTAPITAGVPVIHSLLIEGQPTEGELLRVAGDFSDNTEVEGSLFEWFRDDLKLHTEPIRDYSPVTADIDHVLRCKMTPLDADGVRGEAVTASTLPIAPALPHMERLVIMGEPFHDVTFQVQGKYVGGTRGACQTSWFRKLEGGAWTAIAGANQASYTANADDIGATLRCKFVPRRADDVTGEAAFAETGPIQINPIVEAAVVNSISGVPVTFNVVQIKDGRDVDRVILCNREKVKIRDGSKTKDKAPYSDELLVLLDPYDDILFRIQLRADDVYEFKAESAEQRDTIAITIRHLSNLTDAVPAASGRGFC